MQTVLLNTGQFDKIVQKLAALIEEKYADLSSIAIVGIQQGGVVVADALMHAFQTEAKPLYGQIDITFYRDDLHNKILQPDKMDLPFDVDKQHIILVDDVLFTGRTIKAALDVLLDYGRPSRVELCVLVDRPEHRQFPIRADFIGMTVSTDVLEKIKLRKNEKQEVEVMRMSA